MRCAPTTRLLILAAAFPVLAGGCSHKTSHSAAGGRAHAAAGATATAAATKSPAPAPTPAPAAKPLPPLPTKLSHDPEKHRGAHLWSYRFGGVDRDAARGVAVDKSGDVYITGYFSKSVDFGDGKTLTADGLDAYLVKRKPDGKLAWVVQLGGRGDDIGNSVAVDSKGDAVVVGSFANQLKVGNGTLNSGGADDIFVAKFSPDGHRLWASRFGGRDVDAAEYVAVGPSGGVLVTGVYRASVLFGTQITKSAGDADIFLLKLGSDGEVKWSRHFGSIGPDYGRAVAFDADGNIAFLGEFSGTVSFGGAPLVSAGNRDLVVARFTPTGKHMWSRRFGNDFNELGVGLAVDPTGNIVATGSFDQSIDFGTGKLKCAGRSDVFLAKFSPKGKTLWAKSFGDKDEDIGAAVATDRFGNIALTGWNWYTINFGNGPLTSAGKKDVFLALLSPDGRAIWSKRFGDKSYDQGRSVAFDPHGDVVVVGTYRYTINFGGKNLAYAHKQGGIIPYGDAFVAEFSP